MTVREYDSQVREVAHYNGYIVVNQSYWYPENQYTEAEAISRFKKKNHIAE